MTCELWLGYAEQAGRREVLMALKRIAPGSAVVFARNAQELRERFREEEPGTVGAIIGHTEDGVSDMNLAAAVIASLAGTPGRHLTGGGCNDRPSARERTGA